VINVSKYGGAKPHSYIHVIKLNDMNINDVVKISSNEQYRNVMFRIIKVNNKTVTVRELPDAQLHAYIVRVNKDNVTVISNEQYEQYRQIQRNKYITSLAELRSLISEADYNMRKERYDAYYL
jgi:hypothetical protein